jgi:hypothetical protein
MPEQFWHININVVSPLKSMFSINQPLFLQKTKRLYPNIYLELGFESGPQRIRDLAIVCP